MDWPVQVASSLSLFCTDSLQGSVSATTVSGTAFFLRWLILLMDEDVALLPAMLAMLSDDMNELGYADFDVAFFFWTL